MRPESMAEQTFLRRSQAIQLGMPWTELADQGWAVHVDVMRGQLTWFLEPLQDYLRNAEFDYVARKGDEIIIGEIKSRNPQSLQPRRPLTGWPGLWPRCRTPGWRFTGWVT